MTLNLFASTAPGLEPLTAAELRARGAKSIKEVPGGVEFAGSLAQLYAANLWLRTASRVLVRVAEFRASAFSELERRGRKVEWDCWLAAGRPLRLSVTCRKSRLYHSKAVAERVLDAIERSIGAVADAQLAKDGGDEQDDAPAAQHVFVRLFHDLCTVSVDSSGELLHRRGYRQAISKAPLRETLAAGMLLACNWKGDRALLDPMCGSGTIPIEAALLARNMAPGIGRRFAFESWPGFDEMAWKTVRDEAHGGALKSAPAPILASDIDRGAVTAAIANAQRAGVAADIDFQVRPLSEIGARPAPGLLLSNPPYGVRVGEQARLRGMYQQIGDTTRAKLPGWTVGLLVPKDAPVAATGLPFEEKLDTSNGGIRVRLLTGHVPSGS